MRVSAAVNSANVVEAAEAIEAAIEAGEIPLSVFRARLTRGA